MDYWLRPQISYIVFGQLADRPARPDARHHSYLAIDTQTLFFSDLTRNWFSISGGSLPLSITNSQTVQANQQIVCAKTTVDQSGGLLTIESGSLLRFVA